MLLANGEMTMIIDGVETIDIHGSVYYNLTFRLNDEAAAQTMRINPEAFYYNPKAGDTVKVNMVMGNIMGAEKII